MRESLLHRVLGLGKLPESLRISLEAEGIALLDEGFRASLTFERYRAPGKRFVRKRTWFPGTLVVTERRFAAFGFSKTLVNVPFEDARFASLDFSDTRTVRGLSGSRPSAPFSRPTRARR